MSLLNKLGMGHGARDITRSAPERPATAGSRTSQVVPVAVGSGSPRAPQSQGTNRISNGLKEFLWNLDGIGRGTLLDLGSAGQTTLSFFIEKGFRVTSDDLLRGWKQFLDQEEKDSREAGKTSHPPVDVTPTGRATRYLESNLSYP